MKNKKIQIRFSKKITIEEKINSIDKKSLELFAQMMRDKKTDITKLLSVYLLNHVKSFDISLYNEEDFNALIDDFFNDILAKGLI